MQKQVLSMSEVAAETKGAMVSALSLKHGRMVRGGHGLSKVLLGPVRPYPFMPCGWPSTGQGGLQPSSTPLDTPRRTPMAETKGDMICYIMLYYTISWPQCKV
jgi:hypothetical protein